MSESKTTIDYRLFDPEAYLNTYYRDVAGDTSEGDMLTRQMQFLHEAFSGGKITGRRLLDIGTGPTIHSLISASPHVDDIVLSDFAPQNREVLRKWREGCLDHSFTSFFQHVVEKEGRGESASAREASLKDKVSAIIPVDLTQTNPLTPSLFQQFDVINSSLCMEAVVETISDYTATARRVTDLLKDGGHLVLFGVLGERFYQVGTCKFRTLEIYRDDIKRVWEECGLEILDIKHGSHSVPDKKESSDFAGYFLMVAKKGR